ncbi:MAG TPA: glycosyltransferase [Gemmatimonadales bacterium]|jgi:polysaccharide deacetylase family protein (PEP-CTERM system associated)
MNRTLGPTELGITDHTGAAVVSPQSSTDRPVARKRAVSGRTHLLTVALEDYYHAGPFRRWIPHDTWYRFEARVAKSTEKTLALLDSHRVQATFFVPGYLADGMPELVRDIAARGHEIASSGYSHRGVWDMSAEEFRDDVVQAKERLQAAAGRRVLGFRMPQRWLGPQDLWVLEVLAKAGYLYDSSIRPTLHTFAGRSWEDTLLRLGLSGHPFYEVPVSSVQLCGLRIPVAGGGALRHLPRGWMRRAVSRLDRHSPTPYVMYFRTWELDPDQPRISIAPFTARVRQYRNLDRMELLLDGYLGRYRFTSISEYHRLAMALPEPAQAAAVMSAAPEAVTRAPSAVTSGAAPTAATIVVPCYNETQSLPYLRNTLRSVAETYRDAFTFSFVFVDDCSTDGTWDLLQALFSSDPNCVLVRHAQNQGIAGTIQTGMEHARTEVVCSIDCDCTYDPHELGRMIPLLSDGVDVVTASPYHPAGHVRNVPGWRLFLSKSLSRMYRAVLRQQLFTYTSCFRVYRRESATALRVGRTGFLGIAELLARLDLAGCRVVEYPTTLQSRILGRSKMKVARTIVGHMGLLADLIWLRLIARGGNTPAKASS